MYTTFVGSGATTYCTNHCSTKTLFSLFIRVIFGVRVKENWAVPQQLWNHFNRYHQRMSNHYNEINGKFPMYITYNFIIMDGYVQKWNRSRRLMCLSPLPPVHWNMQFNFLVDFVPFDAYTLGTLRYSTTDPRIRVKIWTWEKFAHADMPSSSALGALYR